MPHLYAIAIGSNRPHFRHGRPAGVVEAAIARLDEDFGLFDAAPILLNPAIGHGGRDFASAPMAGAFARYVRRHRIAHGIIVSSVCLAVLCSVATQYGVKLLVDTLSQPDRQVMAAWTAFAALVAFITADNLLWRVAAWIGHSYDT